VKGIPHYAIWPFSKRWDLKATLKLLDEIFTGSSIIRSPTDPIISMKNVRPIVRDGVRQGAICTFRDIAEERKAAERQALLIQELNRRVKSLLLNNSTLLNAFGDMEAKFVDKAVVITDGKAGTVENVWLDEHHRLLISIRGHDGKWPISTIKFAQEQLVDWGAMVTEIGWKVRYRH